MVLNYIVQFLEYAIQLVSSIVVARIAGPTVFGILAFGLSYVSLVNMFVAFGFGSAHLKMVSEGRDVSKCITAYSLMTLINISLLALGVTGLFMLQKHVFHVQFESPVHERVIFIYLLYQIINALLAIPNMTFAAKLEFAKKSIPHIIQLFFYNIGRIVIVLMGFGAVAISWMHVASFLIVIPLTLRYFREYSFGPVDFEYIKTSFKYAVPLFFISTAYGLTHYFDKVLLQFYISSDGLGYYGASQKIGGLISMLGGSMGILFFPLFSKYISDGKKVLVAHKISIYFRFCTLFIMPMVFILLFHSDVVILLLLGADYVPSIMPMKFFTLSSFIYLINLPFGNVITGAGRFKKGMYINITSSLFYIGTLMILIHPKALELGLLGASIAVVAYNLFNTNIYMLYAKRIIPEIIFKPLFRSVFAVSLTCIIIGVLSTFLKQLFPGLLASVTVMSLSSLTIYVVLILIGAIRRDDYKLILALINPKKMNEYVKNEVSI